LPIQRPEPAGNLKTHPTLRRPDVRPYHDGATHKGAMRTAGGNQKCVACGSIKADAFVR